MVKLWFEEERSYEQHKNFFESTLLDAENWKAEKKKGKGLVTKAIFWFYKENREKETKSFRYGTIAANRIRIEGIITGLKTLNPF